MYVYAAQVTVHEPSNEAHDSSLQWLEHASIYVLASIYSSRYRIYLFESL